MRLCLTCFCVLGVGFFFLYFVYEGIWGIFLDFNDKLDVLVLVSGIFLVVGIDFYVGELFGGRRAWDVVFVGGVFWGVW